MVEIFQAEPETHAASVRELFWEYFQWGNQKLNEEFAVNFDIASMLEQEIVELGKFLPPDGRLLLGQVDGQLAATACLKKLSGTVGEVKRMYVRPAFRRHGLGRALLGRLEEEGHRIGYQHLRLDSARFMTEAHALYHSLGFEDIPPYEGTEIPKDFQVHWVFMEKVLAPVIV